MSSKSKQKLVSFRPILCRDWVVKASSLNEGICVVMTNINTGSTLVNYFNNEMDAALHIEYWIENYST